MIGKHIIREVTGGKQSLAHQQVQRELEQGERGGPVLTPWAVCIIFWSVGGVGGWTDWSGREPHHESQESSR